MPQERWSRHLDYIVTMLGSSIGSGSFTKFPYFCMRNGGGAYLIVFAFFTIIAAIPCVFLEMVVGQFSQGGLIKVWNLCPPFKGLMWALRLYEGQTQASLISHYIKSSGCVKIIFSLWISSLGFGDLTAVAASIVMANQNVASVASGLNAPADSLIIAGKGIGVGIVVSTWLFYSYYNVIFSWFLFYGYSSFSSTLPWSHCANPWNTPECISGAAVVNTTYPNVTDLPANVIDGTVNLTDSVVRMTATEEFWKFNVLDMTDGLDDLGRIRWPLAGCLLCTHLIVYLCVFRGIKVSGKIAYITVSMPYILVTTFLVRGCLLPGAVDGIYFYIYPQFQKLLEPKIWIEACSFSLYSMSIAMGYIVTLSGHNKFNNNCFRDAVVVCIVDSLSTVFIGFAFFAIVGHVAFKSGVAVEAFESSGFNLAFIVFPEILTYLPLPQLWSVLTFVMLMTLHIDTMVPTVEILMEAFWDLFPNIQRWRFLAIGGILLSSFLMGIVYITQGGIYVLTLVDWFAYFPSLALYAMLECVVVGWCYGTQKLQDDILIMWGRSTPRVIMTAIRFICPVLLTIIYCNSLYSYRPPKYGDYDYPTWATRVGWLISSVSILPFPAVFLWTVYNTPGNTLKEKLRTSLKPNRRWYRPSPESALSDVPIEQASEDGQ